MSPPQSSVALQNGDGTPPDNKPRLSPINLEYTTLIDQLHRRIESGQPFFSLEFFPPRTVTGVSNLFSRLERMNHGSPLFVDITWHPAGEPNSKKETSSSSIAGACLNYCQLETMLHMTCGQYEPDEVIKHLQRAKSMGIRNILALRGDLPEDENNHAKYKSEELRYASDMVRLIRKEYGNYFVIAVAGYPCGHPDAENYDADIEHLKAKVDAGADFIITQLFFRVETYLKFVADCRAIGITVPIIPGIMPIQFLKYVANQLGDSRGKRKREKPYSKIFDEYDISYDSLRHICRLSKLDVPKFILDAVEPIRQNDEAIRNYGVSWAVKMIRDLAKSGQAPGYHFYTLNREIATTEILKATGLWSADPLAQKILPWKAGLTNHKRCREEVRPIFWSSRPRSYLYRTQDWDDFPNGRWGDTSSPAYGDLRDYYLFHLSKRPQKAELLKMWGDELRSEQDVWDIFKHFVSGKAKPNGVTVNYLPWNENDSLSAESTMLINLLQFCNEHGILTINSQPPINCVKSTDPVVGWGSQGGYVYQKAYLEFFMSQDYLEAFLSVIPNYPQVNFHILNKNESINICNSVNKKPIAVTWGVFHGSEIIQPTVVDPVSFHVWKSEAYDVWTSTWAKIYPDDSKSREILTNISNAYVLVNLVDNDYPTAPDTVLDRLLHDMVEAQADLDLHSSGGTRLIRARTLSQCQCRSDLDLRKSLSATRRLHTSSESAVGEVDEETALSFNPDSSDTDSDAEINTASSLKTPERSPRNRAKSPKLEVAA